MRALGRQLGDVGGRVKTFKLADFAEDGVLKDPEDAEFLAKKLGDENALDFEGIVAVAPEYLDALLAGQKPESLEGRITGTSEAVDEALVTWLERQKSPARPAPSAPKGGAVPKIRTGRPLEFERIEPEGERYSPTRLVSRLRRQLTSYIESAYPLSDPILVRARKKLLEETADGRLLAQEPYVEATPRYVSFEGGYKDLGLSPHVASLLDSLSRTPGQYADQEKAKTVLYPGMYAHQASAFQAFLRDGKEVVVATGTGSGKTECFLVPLLATLYDEAVTRPASFPVAGVRALILYPMNALVNDQLARLRLLLGDQSVARQFRNLGAGMRHATFGMYTGRTPYPGPRAASRDGERVAPLLEYFTTMDEQLEKELRKLGRYPAKDLEAFYGKQLEQKKRYRTGKKAGQEYTEHNWPQRLHTHPGDTELLTRQEMVRGAGSDPGNAPDVIVTNYSMLEYMLMRPFERPLFDQTKAWLDLEGNQLLLVVDEAHMYRGAKGAEVAFLLRRLRARLGIHDRPEKLRVIATSASLGNDEEALEAVRRFVADLTGKQPEDVVSITGRRETPPGALPGDDLLAELLAGMDPEALHGAASADTLRRALVPLFDHFGAPSDGSTDEALLRHLYEVLDGKPFVKMLLVEAASGAKALGKLAGVLFPDHPKRIKATEVLLTLVTIARKQGEEPGLIPTRIHAFFRGLNALYACINPRCSGRQDGPGEFALVGKLFAEPCAICDACGSRVFELASCRSCGSPYLYAYTNLSNLAGLDFLWGETEGNLTKVGLLPCPPRYEEASEEIRVHLRTGYVDLRHEFPEDEVRSLWLGIDTNHTRTPEFERCAMCQPPSSHSRSRISDFRTKGEQPFTSLVDAQFAEQAPQKPDKRLPNRGRKVLIFSDGRQKAARLAPALESSHARDLFRQVLALATEGLSRESSARGMGLLYPGAIWVCNTRGINLFPEPDEREFHEHLRRGRAKTLPQLIQEFNGGILRPTLSYARQLFSEMTDRYYSLNSLALASVEEDPLIRPALDDFPEVGLDEPQRLALLRIWIRMQLENRRFLPQGADTRSLGDEWERPDGIDPDKPAQLLPRPFPDFIRRLVQGESQAQSVAGWFKEFVRAKGFLRLENDAYYLQTDGLTLQLRLDSGWLRCDDCGRLWSEALRDLCPACLGRTVEVDRDYLQARTGYYREQVLRAMDPSGLEPFGLVTAEHSAQLTGQDDGDAYSKTEKYELRFQDIQIPGQDGQPEPPIDVLSCTTTMEVGIDIGTLSGVALRNVPPHVANYQQRSGRAGRRGRSVASVITYAHGTSHDAFYYASPAAIITGDVLSPVVYIENQQVLQRHIHAFLVQRFFHETVVHGTNSYQLFESLGSVANFLDPGQPCSFAKLADWLERNKAVLESELGAWVPRYSHSLGEPVAGVDETISTALDGLLDHLRRALPVEEVLGKDALDGMARESLERRLEEGLLATLVGRAVLPRYAFPTDVVTFWVARPKRRGDPPHKRSFDYEPQRDLQIALSEYAPGASLTIDKWRFESAALYSPYSPDVGTTLDRAQSYVSCKACGYVDLQPAAAQAGNCPCCRGADLVRQAFLTPEGFAPDINEKRKVDRGEAPERAGRATRAQLEVQEPPNEWDEVRLDGRLSVYAGPRNLVTVNKGIGDRGFLVCPACARSERVLGPGYPKSVLFRGGVPRRHLHPLEQGAFCDARAQGPFFLGHKFPTDVLLMKVETDAPVICAVSDSSAGSGAPARAALTSLVEAMCLAASNVLQIEEGEIAGNWSPVLNGDGRTAHLFLYDLLPGGAGYTRLVKENLQEVLDETFRIVTGCTCESSCYKCIRHYGNGFLHASLDRRLAGALLGHLRTGESPTLCEAEVESAKHMLQDILRLKGLRSEADEEREGLLIPLVIHRPDAGEIWVDFRHPLVDPNLGTTAVAQAASAAFVEYCSLDAFTVRHDLPTAVATLKV